jgi:hypothetical protein
MAVTDEEGNVYSCTHAVQLTDTSREKILNHTYMDSGFTQTGDGAGTLYDSLGDGYALWNREEDNTGGWPASRIRAVLNGAQAETADGTHNETSTVAGTDIAELTITGSLFGAFPAELQGAIEPKRVRSDPMADVAKDHYVTTFDRLWLFSGAEIWNTFEGFDEEGFSGLGGNWDAIHEDESVEAGKDYDTYTRQRLLEIYANDSTTHYKMKTFTDNNNYWSQFWLRTTSRGSTGYVFLCDSTGSSLDDPANYTTIGVAPGFCIGEIEE